MRFYLSKIKQANGDFEVHSSTCVFLPMELHRLDLGEHLDCSSALKVAKNVEKMANGCYFCARLCHQK